MRILHIGLSSLKGGVEACALNYSYALKDRGIVFDHIDVYDKGIAVADEIKSLGGKIYTIPNFRSYPSKARKEFKRIITENGYECVHIHMLSCANLMFVRVALKLGVKIVVHSHNTVAVGVHRKLLHSLNSRKMQRYPLIRLACGEQAGNWMHRGAEFTVLPNAVDTAAFGFDEKQRKITRGSLGIADDTFVIGFVGRLSEQKNPLYLVKIFNALKDSGKAENTKMLVAGTGPMRQVLENAVCDSGLQDSILLLGNRTDVAQLYNAMDALVMPSFFEGLPVVAVEAQVNGLPCFVSDCVTDEVCITDLVTKCGLTNDALCWARAIDGFVQHKERAEYADEIRKTPYSIEGAAEMLEEIYKF